MNMRLFLTLLFLPLSLFGQSAAERRTPLERSLEQRGLVDALKVYDAARPMRIQQRMWNAVAGTSKNIYVSNPARGGGLHNYGLAVDLTLCWARDVRDGSGRLLHAAGDTTGLSMGTPIDYLGAAAHVRDEARLVRRGILRPEQVRLRRILREAMSAGGFRVLATEWWHFNFKTRAQARAHYTPIP